MTNLVRYGASADRFLDTPEFGVHPVIGKRLSLHWQAGVHGKPSLNAVAIIDPDADDAAALAAYTINDKMMEVLGTNMTTALATWNAEGGITLTTAGADEDQAILAPHLDANQSPWTKYTWGTDRETHWEGYFETGASIADVTIWAGLKLTNDNVVATDADQVFIRYADSGNWIVVSSIGGTDTETDSGVAVAASTKYHVGIKINADRTAEVFINGVFIYKTAALTDAVDFIPYIGVEAGTGAAKAITVFDEAISRLYGA